MNLGGIATIIYGVLVFTGGIIGYAQAKSKASLLAGCISGILLLIAGLIQLDRQEIGALSALVITLVLVVMFTVRLRKTRRFMPAGLMLIAGVATLSIIAFSWLA